MVRLLHHIIKPPKYSTLELERQIRELEKSFVYNHGLKPEKSALVFVIIHLAQKAKQNEER